MEHKPLVILFHFRQAQFFKDIKLIFGYELRGHSISSCLYLSKDMYLFSAKSLRKLIVEAANSV